jgi:hypothetical protein
VNIELARGALATDIAGVTTDLMFLGRLIESLSFEPAVAERPEGDRNIWFSVDRVLRPSGRAIRRRPRAAI